MMKMILLVVVLLQLLNIIHSISLKSIPSPIQAIIGFYAIMNAPIYGIGLLSSSDVAGGFGSMTDFSIVRNRLPPSMQANEYIMCPKGKCPNAQVIRSPEYNVDSKALEKIVDKVILSSDLRTNFIQEDKATNRREYVQRMRLLNWPDIITVQFYGDDDNKKSTIAMHSYSIFGGSDLGVNRNRVRDWLVQIDQELKSQQ